MPPFGRAISWQFIHMMELSNCFQCVMHDALRQARISSSLFWSLVCWFRIRTWLQIFDMDHKSETSFTNCHIKSARVKQKKLESRAFLPLTAGSKIQLSPIWSLYTVVAAGECELWLQLDNVQSSFLKRSLSVCPVLLHFLDKGLISHRVDHSN